MWDDRTWIAIEQAIEAMERAQRDGAAVPFEDLLPPPGDPRREGVLATLIKVDQEQAWAAGRRPLVEAYLADWPELADKPEVVADLLRAEYRTRKAHDAAPTPEEVESRFPSLVMPPDEDSGDVANRVSCRSSVDRELLTSFFGSVRSGHTRPADGEQAVLSPGARLGRYRLKAILGRGGMGVVYLAEDEELHRPVAVKVLHPWIFLDSQLGQILLDEARTAARLRHASIVPVYDVGRQDDGSYFFVMEYVEGRSLAELIGDGPVGRDRAIAWAAQLADALDQAHREGFVHRDIKPSNILIDRDGRARIVDFGLARNEQDEDRPEGEYSGTLPYMAPEQIRGEAQRLDGRADLWALGVVLYEMLTGRRPFEGDSREALRRAITETEPTQPSRLGKTIPRDVERICMQCLRKVPADRPLDAAALAEALRKLPRRRKPRRTAKALVMLAVAGALLLMGVLAVVGLPDTWFRSNRAVVAMQPESSAARLRPRRNAEPQEVVPWLAPCKLVLLADTGATVDLAAAEFLRATPQKMYIPRMITYDGARATVVDSSIRIENHWLRWEVPLTVLPPSGDDQAQLAPERISIRLRLAVNRDGRFQIGTFGGRPEEHLATLTQNVGICNYEYFGGRRLPETKYDSPHNFSLDTDARQTLLAKWLEDIYVLFGNNQLLRGGAADGAELYECPFELRNFFSRPITVVHGRLHHQRFDNRYKPQEFLTCEEKMNDLWSPAAKRPNTDVDLEFDVTLRCGSAAPSALYLQSASDNGNTSSSTAHGLDSQGVPDPSPPTDRVWVKFDRNGGVCEAGNSDQGQAMVLLYNQGPSRIELRATSTWSIVEPFFRYVTLGEVEVLHCESEPKGLSARKIEPQIWVIPPEG